MAVFRLPAFRLRPRAGLLAALLAALFLLVQALPAPAQENTTDQNQSVQPQAAPVQDGLPEQSLVGGGPALVQGADKGKPFTQPLPAGVEDSLTYLLGLVGQRGATLQTERLAPLLALAVTPGLDARQFKPAKREDSNGVCLREDIQAPLERILRWGYNKDIPNHVIFPSVLRLTGWQPGSDILTRQQGLWEPAAGDLPAPIMLWGREFEVNTPDSSTGAYYRYDLDRLIVLLRHQGHNVLVSVSRMPHESDGGKKGVPMDDLNWNYFYSGIKGLDRGLIGWMDTSLYHSLSVQLFYEEDRAAPRTTCLLFKWLSGGWAGLNVIMAHHIYDGNLRFLKGFKKVMESPALPDPARFAAAVREINALPDPALNEKITAYSRAFEQLAKGFPSMDKSEFRKIWENGGYAAVLDRAERVGVLVLEYLKAKVGKPALVDLSSIDKALAAESSGTPVAMTAAPANGGNAP